MRKRPSASRSYQASWARWRSVAMSIGWPASRRPTPMVTVRLRMGAPVASTMRPSKLGSGGPSWTSQVTSWPSAIGPGHTVASPVSWVCVAMAVAFSSCCSGTALKRATPPWVVASTGTRVPNCSVTATSSSTGARAAPRTCTDTTPSGGRRSSIGRSTGAWAGSQDAPSACASVGTPGSSMVSENSAGPTSRTRSSICACGVSAARPSASVMAWSRRGAPFTPSR